MPAFDLRLTRVAFVGMVTWLALLFVPLAVEAGPAQDAAHLVVLAPLVLVPMFVQASVPGGFGAAPRLLDLGSWLLLPGSLSAAASLLVPVGPLGGVLAGVWGISAAALALAALAEAARQWRAGTLSMPEAILTVGWLTLPCGAVWLVLARSGAETGYAGLIELLTAAHFHYAGALAAVWAALLGRVVAPSLRRLWQGLAGGLAVGFWGVAVGIALSRTPAGGSAIETAGVVLLAASAIGLGGLALWEARRFEDRTAGILVAISGGALVMAMGLALWFHLGGRVGAGPDIAWMVERHGALIAYGFALWGALGWRRLRPRPLS